MKKRYKLFEVRLINDIPMLTYVTTCMAMNIIEAEYMFDNDMRIGCEYQIIFCGK